MSHNCPGPGYAHSHRPQTRREFLRDSCCGFGGLALAAMLHAQGLRAAPANPLAPKRPPLPAKAKSVIFLFMAGGPSQLDLFDPKPELRKWEGQPLPPSMTKDLKLAFIKPTAAIWASPRPFARHGGCGMELSDLVPQIGRAHV